MEQIDIDDIFRKKNPGLYKWLPGFVIGYIKRIVHQDEVNRFILKHGQKKNFEFAQAILTEWNIQIRVNNLANLPTMGGCILAANHPLGGLDAIALISTIGSVRKDLRFVVNDILMNLKNLEDLFIGVNKHGKNNKSVLESLDKLYASDSCILIFPAGLVSRKKGNQIRDLDWKKSFVTKAKMHQRPVIPVHISGKLSPFFYGLAGIRSVLKIKANIEMFYLVDELYKQRNNTIEITFGQAIDYRTFDKSRSDHHWAQFVKEEVYKS